MHMYIYIYIICIMYIYIYLIDICIYIKYRPATSTSASSRRWRLPRPPNYIRVILCNYVWNYMVHCKCTKLYDLHTNCYFTYTYKI